MGRSNKKKGGFFSIILAIWSASIRWAILLFLALNLLIYMIWDNVNLPAVEVTVETRVEVPYTVMVPVDDIIMEVPSEEEPEEIEVEEEFEIEEEEVIEVIAKPALLLDEESKRRQLNLLHQITRAQAKQASYMTELQRRVSLLEHNIVATNTKTLDDGEKEVVDIPIESLTELLTKPTLQTTDDKTLETLLTNALDELQAAIDANVTTAMSGAKKGALTNLLTQTNWTRDVAPLNEEAGNCPTLPDGARASDLRAKISTALHGLSEQRKGRSLDRLLEDRGVVKDAMEKQLVVDLPEGSVLVIDDEDEEEVVVAPTPAPTSSVGATTEDKVCLMPEDLDAMVELAVQSQATELQIALTKFVKEIEPDSQLILDAVLPASTSSSKQRTAPAPTTNLRQALNSEWIWYTATNVVDALVDACGGYLEPLDAAVDSMASDGESVGRVVVARMLQAAAKVPVPAAISDNVNHTRTGMLHHI